MAIHLLTKKIKNLKIEKLSNKAEIFFSNLFDKFYHFLFAGSWSLQFERGSGLVTLRSLLWLGYVFYHVPGTHMYGSCYVGNGEKNLDLPFMLWGRNMTV